MGQYLQQHPHENLSVQVKKNNNCVNVNPWWFHTLGTGVSLSGLHDAMGQSNAYEGALCPTLSPIGSRTV
jgi:hypothetical protein